MKLIEVKECPICNLKIKNFKQIKNSSKLESFYEKHIELFFSSSLRKIKTVQCKRCFTYINKLWFSNEDVFKIYNVIYPQHHRGWKNLYNFDYNKINIYHKKVLEIFDYFKIKNYSEFNTPFSGIFLYLSAREYTKKTFNNLVQNCFLFLKNNQLSKKKNSNYLKAFNKFKNLKKKIENKKVKSSIKKNFFVDNSFCCWGNGDISDGVNSRSLSNLLFDLNTINIEDKNINNFKSDLFFFADSLDHTSNPNKVLNFAINSSKIVLILTNSRANVTKQHLFSLSKNIIDYLNKKHYSKIIMNDKRKNQVLLAITKHKSIFKKLNKCTF